MARRPMAHAVLVAFALALGGSAGCDGGPPGSYGRVHLTWELGDGRACTDANVLTVEVRTDEQRDDDAPAATFDCEVGLALAGRGGAPQSVGRAIPTSGARLRLQALTPQGSALYRAELDARPPRDQVTEAHALLRYTGGR